MNGCKKGWSSPNFGLKLRIRREDGITGVKVSSKSYTQNSCLLNIYDLNFLKDKTVLNLLYSIVWIAFCTSI